jgi:hypothetical protein
MPSPQFRYWLLTIPHHHFVPFLPNGIVYIKGQLEEGNGTGYRHWQLIAHSGRKITLSACKAIFGQQAHIEASRSEAAEAYVWKDDTRIEGTQFTLGKTPFKRNSDTDWKAVLDAAKAGNYDSIPPDVQVRCYNQLKRITADHLQPCAIEREVVVFWGRTGTGKSRRAWEEAGLDAFPKDPNTKFWCGYRGILIKSCLCRKIM